MPAFVILEHRWNGVHWDFMLEAGEALRTWAIDSPIVAGSDLPARALPDHRLAYLDYEGEISEGRGTVQRLDRGTYEVLAWSPDQVLVRIFGSVLQGELVQLHRSQGEEEPNFDWRFRLGTLD
ncbi:hypothetical protein BH23PLA1_BH23PLA1_10970 [soil metagenome]